MCDFILKKKTYHEECEPFLAVHYMCLLPVTSLQTLQPPVSLRPQQNWHVSERKVMHKSSQFLFNSLKHKHLSFWWSKFPVDENSLALELSLAPCPAPPSVVEATPSGCSEGESPAGSTKPLSGDWASPGPPPRRQRAQLWLSDQK